MNSRPTTHITGDLGEVIVTMRCIERGWHVYRPFTECSPADLIVQSGKTIVSVQVKAVKRHKTGFYVPETDDTCQVVVGVDTEANKCWVFPQAIRGTNEQYIGKHNVFLEGWRWMWEPITREILIRAQIDRDLHFVTESGCWIWTGDTNGPGKTPIVRQRGHYVNLRNYFAGRTVKGTQSEWLEPTCGVAECVRPDHQVLRNCRELRIASARPLAARVSPSSVEGVHADRGAVESVESISYVSACN